MLYLNVHTFTPLRQGSKANGGKQKNVKVMANFYVAMHKNSSVNTVQNDTWDKKHWRSLRLTEG